jgi:hypothetical protein
LTTFQFTSGADKFDLDMAGQVFREGELTGHWNTNRSNQIVVTKTDGSVLALRVDWLFNQKNQLTTCVQGREIFNFASVPELRNSFETRNAVLQVRPDRLNPFVFPLHGEWDMDKNHNLTFTAGGIVSTLDGFVSDPLGRFIYHFANKDNPLETNVLGFAGSWQGGADAPGTPLLEFHYQKEPAPDGRPGGQGVFRLPQAVAINRSTNQLTYTYKKGNKTLSIDFQGTLMLGPDFQITYVVQRQVSNSGDEMVSSTTLGFGATVTKPNLHGDLELTLKKPDGSAGSAALTIGGQFQGVLGKTNLQIGFTFTQIFGGASNQITRTAAFQGSVKFADGQVQWTFSATGSTLELAIGTDIKLGSIQADARLNIGMDGGELAGVTFMLGVNF